VVPCHHGMARPQVADGDAPYSTKGKCENIEKQSRTSDKRWSHSLGLDEVLKTPQRKNVFCYEIFLQKVSDMD
jgi:hypothetical protein